MKEDKQEEHFCGNCGNEMVPHGSGYRCLTCGGNAECDPYITGKPIYEVTTETKLSDDKLVNITCKTFDIKAGDDSTEVRIFSFVVKTTEGLLCSKTLGTAAEARAFRKGLQVGSNIMGGPDLKLPGVPQKTFI